MSSVYDFSVTLNNGESLPLKNLQGDVLLFVNTASRCGFTPQYEGLEMLHQKYAEQGLTVIGFPCNQFGGQEPGTDEEIARFCTLNVNVTFLLSVKIDVNGDNTDPLFSFLKDNARGVFGSKRIKWNFTKFVVDRDGAVKIRFAPTTKPEALEKALLPMIKA